MASFLSIPGDGQSGKNSLQLSKCPTLNVVRADGLPHLRTLFGAERKFYVTATDGVKTAKTSAIRSREGSVQWDEVLSGFAVNPSSRLIVRIFAHRTRNESVLMGTVAIPFESLYSFSLNAFDIPVESTQRTTLVLSISLSDAPQRATVAAVSSSKVPEASTRAASMPLRAFGSNVLLGDEPVDQNQASAEALRGAEEAMANIKTFQGSPLDFMEAANEVPDNLERIVDFYDTWNVTLKNVQWIVGVVDKIAEIHPWAKMAWSILSCIPKVSIPTF
ncbi:hypothetical protein BC834DRAFT_887042 [Gloeopeniophorella convolvens]|nr:hypothetical protein BC834DRAFT_887042 [Gloeopeniophorella convolvens]